jgi:hypothetical protein
MTIREYAGRQSLGVVKYGLRNITWDQDKGVFRGAYSHPISGNQYRFEVIVRNPHATPQVFLTDPLVDPKCPHIYLFDKSLCLYFPPDFHWDQTKLIASTIIPWTICWLYFYDKWLRSGVWYGPESPHNTEPND